MDNQLGCSHDLRISLGKTAERFSVPGETMLARDRVTWSRRGCRLLDLCRNFIVCANASIPLREKNDEGGFERERERDCDRSIMPGAPGKLIF